MTSAIVRHDTQIPYVSGVIERPNLLAQLQAAASHKLTLICAPAGYGKTTIAAQFARRSSIPIVWHALEERARDVPHFYHQATAALEECVPGIQALSAPPGYSPGELAALMADYIRDNLPGRMIYILDDSHVLAGSPPAETFVETLVELLPGNCHMVLIGRKLPNLPLTEMIARREVIAFGQDQLRFTPDEIRRLASETLGTELSRAEVDGLAARLEGWPAGTVLALHPLPTDLEQAMLSGGRGPEALFNALAASMLETQPPDLRDFLLASSTLFKMTPERCATILELPDSSYWLQELQRRNLFLSRIGGGLVYHRLFRDFLQNELSQDNSRLFISLHVKAARWLEENEHLEDSFTHYLAAGLVERAAGIAERVADAYFIQGNFETLVEWRARLGRMTAFAPKLLFNCARIHTDRYDYEDAETALDDAQRVFEETNNEVGVTDVYLQRAFIKLQKGETTSAISEAMRFVSSTGDAARSRGRALNILGVAHLRLGEAKIAVVYLEQALALHRKDGDAHALANVLQDLGVAYLRQGRLNDASACLQEVVALRRSLGSPSTVAAALNNLGYYYHLDGNYDQAITTFQEGLNIIARVPNKRSESALSWSMGDVRRDQGAFDEALRLYNVSLALIGDAEPSMRSSVLISSATLRRWQGRIQESVLLAERALALAETHQVALQDSTARAAWWAARALLGEAEPAREALDHVLEDLRVQDARLKLVWALGLSAHTALLCGDRRAADHYLGLALQEAEQGGSAQPLVAEIAHSPRLELHIVGQPAPYGDLIRSLKKLQGAQHSLRNPVRSVQADIPDTYSVRVVTLGHEKIERDGEPIPASEWRSSAAREIFLHLLFNGPESREQISLAFWPDSPTSQVRSNFHTTLYRARQALGERVIVFQDGYYRINPDLDLWCDAHELEKLVRQARFMPPRDARTEDLWRKAADLYHGDFLPSMDTDWVIYRRESSLECYIEALNGLGNCARVRHDSREALRAYQRVLEIDPYREDTHRAIMTCYAQLGEKQQILAHFRRLQTLLDEELGLEPSSETASLANSLLK